MTPGALLKFRRPPVQPPKRAPERPRETSQSNNDALSTRSLLKLLSALRAERRRIATAISVLERFAGERTSEVAGSGYKGLRLLGK